MLLFEPDRHERLSAARWDASAARRTIDVIVHDCEAWFSSGRLWPPHPLDAEGEKALAPYTMLYCGAAGTIWALDELARRGMASRTGQFADVLAELESLNLREIGHPSEGVESYLIGRSGVLLTCYRVRPSEEIAERLAQSIAANMRNPTRELLWGAPGTMHAALAMHEWTGEGRWSDLFISSARALKEALIEGPEACQSWDQELYGRRSTYLGAGHGFAGNSGAILRGLALFASSERAEWIECIVKTTLATARREGSLVNWPALLESARDERFLVQWCHGAPGFVTSLATLRDKRLDELLIGAGELVWKAGPLCKGAGFCHGTAGNGYAFLKLFARTGDQLWLDRARAFAMHAIEQSEAHAASYGMRRYSLYTGDPGLALYLVRCIEGKSDWPSLDPES
jgi:lantibiotic modifying enzyme